MATARSGADLVRAPLRDELARLPVSQLREMTKDQLRLGPLEAVGFTTVASLVNERVGRLQVIDGVGPDTAAQVVGATYRLHRALDGSTAFRRPGFDRTIRGRSWAVHDGILGALDGVARVGAEIDDMLLVVADLAPAVVLNRPDAMASNGSKPYQYSQIRSVGWNLRIPHCLPVPLTADLLGDESVLSSRQ